MLQGWKWKNISMDFVLGLVRSDRWNDAIWKVAGQLTKSVLFLLIKIIDLLDTLAMLYIDEVVKLHGVLVFIVYDQDAWSTS